MLLFGLEIEHFIILDISLILLSSSFVYVEPMLVPGFAHTHFIIYNLVMCLMIGAISLFALGIALPIAQGILITIYYYIKDQIKTIKNRRDLLEYINSSSYIVINKITKQTINSEDITNILNACKSITKSSLEHSNIRYQYYKAYKLRYKNKNIITNLIVLDSNTYGSLKLIKGE